MMIVTAFGRGPSAARRTPLFLLSLLLMLLLLCGGCGSDSGESVPAPPPQLTPASQALSIWTIEIGRLTEYYLSLPALPPQNGGVLYEPSLGLYFTINNFTGTSYTIKYYLDANRKNPAGDAAVTFSPPGGAYPKTVNIDNELIASQRIASFKGRVTLTYLAGDRPSRITGQPFLDYYNGRRIPVTFDLTPNTATGVVGGSVTGNAAVGAGQTQVATLLNNLAVAAPSGVMTGACAVPGTTVSGTFKVDPFGTGIVNAVDPNAGRFSVSWNSTGVVTLKFLDYPGTPPIFVPWY